MRIVVTGGPGSEPIDEVRYITNQSTGELSVKLARRFAEAGHRVELFLGRGAIWRLESAKYFQTTDELRRLLSDLTDRNCVDAVFHAAALSDFGVEEIIVDGVRTKAAKISSNAESIQLLLRPRPKLIRQLRELFPSAYIVGWKFELDGNAADIIQEGVRQIATNRTNGCVVNGAAFGPGFGFCTVKGLIQAVPTKAALTELLLEFVSKEQSGKNCVHARAFPP
jgi:phosphopantothenoylcysteine synthetase/decarboxylase